MSAAWASLTIPRRGFLYLCALILLSALLPAGDIKADAANTVATLISAAKGTYPASKLPLMCVAVNPARASPRQNLALVQKLGARCVRSDNGWDTIERPGAAGSYDWSIVDDFWTTFCRAKIKPIMIITYNNPLYAAGRFRAIEGDVNIAAYKNFAVATANHFIGICPNMAEELFNEPSASNWTTIQWTGSSYARMLAPVSAAIKAAQPRVTVYSGGVGVDPRGPDNWITQMVSAGIQFPAVDAYAQHPYFYKTPSPGTPVPEQLLVDADQFAHDAGATGQAKPIVFTEYGFSSTLVGHDLMKQGVYVARGMLAAIVGRYPVQTLYDLVDDGTDDTDEQNTFGLFRNGLYKVPYESKPAALGFRAIIDAMANAKTFTVGFDPALSAPTVSFEKAGSTTFVIWTYDASGPKSYEQPIGTFSRITCKDVFGKIYPCRYAIGTLSMQLSEPSGPVIVTAWK
jgi:hypothetical protein